MLRARPAPPGSEVVQHELGELGGAITTSARHDDALRGEPDLVHRFFTGDPQ
ncbi:hypothetical protein ACFYPA_00090 [Streptomyces sp. NPDC005775]|uniref:hypothetical protein n=1 Tax=unclassified Streptomyces TaxID=2593676 RepID=UPI0033ED23AA